MEMILFVFYNVCFINIKFFICCLDWGGGGYFYIYYIFWIIKLLVYKVYWKLKKYDIYVREIKYRVFID